MMTLTKLIAKDSKDRSKAQKTRREYLVNDEEKSRLVSKLAAAEMEVIGQHTVVLG